MLKKAIYTIAACTLLSTSSLHAYQKDIIKDSITPPNETNSVADFIELDLAEPSFFGIKNAGVTHQRHSKTWNPKYGLYMKTLGANWSSYTDSFEFKWSIAQYLTPDGATYSEMDWTQFDALVKNSQANNIHIIPKFGSAEPNRKGEGSTLISKKPLDMRGYFNFINTVVERYDGDGVDDMPGLVYPIKYWEVQDRPLLKEKWDDDPESLADVYFVAYNAIKKADPKAQVILGMIADYSAHENIDSLFFFKKFLKRVKEIGKTKPYDIINVEWHNIIESEDHAGQFAWYKNRIKDIHKTEAEHGLYPSRIMNLSFSNLAGTGDAMASNIIKRISWMLGLGVEKMFFTSLFTDSAGIGYEKNDLVFSLIKNFNESIPSAKIDKKKAIKITYDFEEKATMRYVAIQRFLELIKIDENTNVIIEAIGKESMPYIILFENEDVNIRVVWTEDGSTAYVPILEKISDAFIMPAIPYIFNHFTPNEYAEFDEVGNIVVRKTKFPKYIVTYK